MSSNDSSIVLFDGFGWPIGDRPNACLVVCSIDCEGDGDRCL